MQLVPCSGSTCCKVYDLPVLILVFILIFGLPCLLFAFVYGHMFVVLRFNLYKAAAQEAAADTSATTTATHVHVVSELKTIQNDGAVTESPAEVSQVVIILNGSSGCNSSSCIPRHHRRRNHAIKTAKVLLLTTVLFIICYLPTYVLWFAYVLHPVTFMGNPITVYLFQSCSMLIFVHSSLNPIVYFASSFSCRRQLRNIVSCRRLRASATTTLGGTRNIRWRDADSFESVPLEEPFVTVTHSAVHGLESDHQLMKRVLETDL